MPLDRTKSIEIARQAGCLIPEIAFDAAQEAGVGFAVALAVLKKETLSNGKFGYNVWGHDSGQQFWGAGEVTKDNYRIYRQQRDREHSCGKRYGNQGCGPMQLTGSGWQDDADAAGGCWDPYVNVLTGLKGLRQLRDANENWTEAFWDYNGHGNPITTYAEPVNESRLEFRRLLGGD